MQALQKDVQETQVDTYGPFESIVLQEYQADFAGENRVDILLCLGI